jgi:hypothetical protein
MASSLPDDYIVEDGKTHEKVHANQQCRGIEFRHARANDSKDRESKAAHQHSRKAWKNGPVVPIRLKQPQRALRREKQTQADEYKYNRLSLVFFMFRSLTKFTDRLKTLNSS